MLHPSINYYKEGELNIFSKNTHEYTYWCILIWKSFIHKHEAVAESRPGFTRRTYCIVRGGKNSQVSERVDVQGSSVLQHSSEQERGGNKLKESLIYHLRFFTYRESVVI